MQENYRELFDIPDEVSWLNCAQHSPAMKSVFEAGQAGLAMKQHPWRLTSGYYQEIMRDLRQTFARLIGARGDDIALIPSVSYGITTAAKNLRLGPGKRVLVLEEQFPSNVYPWQMLAAREGGEVFTIKRPKEGGWTKAIEEALDERVAIVALPNIHWTDGSLIDLEALAPKIHDLGAALVLDLSQSLGVMPLDLEKIRPDYVVSVGYKWLLGPYRCSYFYVAPHRQGGQPIEDTWSGRKGAADSSSLTNYTEEYLSGARRFDVGEQRDYITLPMAEAGLKQILDWGTPTIIEALKPLMGKFAEGAEALGLKPTPVEERAPHILGLAFPEAPARDLPSRLAEEGVYVSLRGNTLRVSPHLYNDERDVVRFLTALDRLRQRGAA